MKLAEHIRLEKRMMMNNLFLQGHIPIQELDDFVKKINTNYNFPFQWQNHRSVKKRNDLFGKIINKGEEYYRMQMGGDFSNDLILSYNTMERFLYAIFSHYPKGEVDSVKEIHGRIEDIRKIIVERDKNRSNLLKNKQ